MKNADEIYRGTVTEIKDGFEDLKVVSVSCCLYCGSETDRDYMVVISVCEEIAEKYKVGDEVSISISKEKT